MMTVSTALPRLALETRLGSLRAAVFGVSLFLFLPQLAECQDLLGLTYLPGQTNVTVISIDPATGTETPLLQTTATEMVGGYIAYDPSSRRVFFEDTSALHVADLARGTSSRVPLELCCPPLTFGAGGLAAAVPTLDWRGLALFMTALLLVGVRLARLPGP